jgi:hypothetical protein
MSKLTNTIPTMSSLEIVDVINEERKAEAAGGEFATLRHADFMVKLERHPGIDSTKFSGQYKDSTGRKLKCYHLPKREAELMVMSESLAVQTRVYDRLAALESGTLPSARRGAVGVDPGLTALRAAKAIESSAKVAGAICAVFPQLGDAAKQTIYAKLVNAAAGQNVVPLPVVEDLLSATAVGELYNISANAVGKLANANGLKVPQYGEFAMDKSQHSEKQMPSFRYNAAGVARIGELVRAKLPPPQQGNLPISGGDHA